MRNKLLLVMIVVFFLGCTSSTPSDTQQVASAVETRCSTNEELCIIGTPGMLNQQGIYSGSDTFFSLVLRNNIAGQEARNVVVQLKNIGPFKIVEGFKSANITNEGVCVLEVGMWGPHVIRDITNTPNPQFVDDLGEPFALHKLNVMYPNEEVEFLWRLRAPTYQEIANVAYEHSFDYVVSYDYSSGILQTVYAMSEAEYQRVLSSTGAEPTTKGTTTGSVGALSVKSNVAEPVRVQGSNSQFSLIYEITNQRNGIPTNPAMFLLQYPSGLKSVGSFTGPRSLEQSGYVDLLSAVNYYNSFPDISFEGGICIPIAFDEDSDILKSSNAGMTALGSAATCSEGFKSVTLSNLLAYIRENFPDLSFDETQPKFVVKFLYPVDLVDETNFLYFPMETNETIDISKIYTFRLKTKYRYSFSGSDDITVVPNTADFESTSVQSVGLLWGDMTPNFDYKAADYTLSPLNFVYSDYTSKSSEFFTPNNTLIMQSDFAKTNYKIKLFSATKELANYNFLHIIGLSPYDDLRKLDNIVECSTDADCGLNYCEIITNPVYVSEYGAIKACHYHTGSSSTLITTPLVFGLDVGYYTGESRINKVFSTGSTFYKVPLYSPLYFVDELPYLERLTSSVNRASVQAHTLNSVEGSLSEIYSTVNDFVNYKSFFEVRDENGLILSDNDPIGYLIDYSGVGMYSNIPENMRIMNSLDNETVFITHLDNGNEIIGLYSSQIGGSLEDTLVLYFFNNDPDNTHFFEYNISFLNASVDRTTGLTRVSTTNTEAVFNNKFESLNYNNFPNTKNVPSIEGNNYLRKVIEIGEDRDMMMCEENVDIRPVMIIDYRDEIRTEPTFDTVTSFEEGSIIIRPAESAAADALALRVPEVHIGVVNMCAKTQ